MTGPKKFHVVVGDKPEPNLKSYVFEGNAHSARGDGKELYIGCESQGRIEIHSTDSLWPFYCKSVRVTIEVIE